MVYLRKSMLWCIFLVFAALMVMVFPGTSFAFSGGSGTASDPYLIATPQDLDQIRNNLSANFKLVNDIDLSGVNWVPIGTSSAPFKGTFDGGGHVIRNLYIYTSTDNTGLFGYLSLAKVKNLGFENAQVQGKNETGVLAGSAVSSNITNVYVKNSQVAGGNGYQVGGLVGSATGSSISNSYSAGSRVTGSRYVGGLVGSQGYGRITTSYATGVVEGQYYVGGLVGWVSGSSNTIVQDTFAIVETHGEDAVGGLVGELSGISSRYILLSSSYSASRVIAPSGKAKGLIGYRYNAGLSKSYWDIEASGCTHSNGGMGKTTAEMKRMATFVGFDFVNTWAIIEDATYPWLKMIPKPAEVGNLGVNSLMVTPPSVSLLKGGTQKLTVMASLSNGTSQDVTNLVTYSSSNTSMVTVSSSGLVTAVDVGSATITVSYEGKTAQVPVSVVTQEQPKVTQTGDIIILKVLQLLRSVTYDCAAGFTVTENGVDVPVIKVEVKDGTDGWPFSEVWLYLKHPVTVGSDVVVRYNPDSNYPLIPIDGGTVTVPTTVVINQSTVPLTLERSTITVQPDGKVVYITFPTKVKVVEYEGSAGYTVYSGGTSIQVTRVVTDGNGAYLYLEHPVPQREIVTVSYIPVQGQEITTVTGTPLSGTTNPVTVVNDSTSPVVIYEAPVVSEDGRTVTITAPSDLQDVIYEGNAGFRVFVGDQEIPVVKVEVKDDKIILYLGVPLIGGQVPEISYTPVEGQPIETSNGTPVSSIDNLQGINQSTLSLDRITVEPNSMSLLEGETQQLTVTAHYSDGSAVDVTTLASYQTDNSQVATVSDDGLVTGVKAGNATVTVTYEGKIATVPVTVAPVLSSITVSPNPISIAKGQSQGITVTATYSDGSTKDVTGEVNFQVEDATIASVINGVVKGLNRGNTQITVVYKDKSTTVPVTVTEAVVSKLEAAPNPISIPKGTSQQITVTVTYSDGSTKDVSGEASYQVGDGSIAIVNGGKVTGLEKGNTKVTITYQGQSLQVPVTVTEAVVTKLKATPNPVSIPKGNSQQITVTAIYSDGSTKDVTTEVNYQAGDASIADVIGGKVTGLKEGSTQVTVSYQGQTIQVPVTVTEAIVTKLEATPNPISVAKGLSQLLTVTAIYSDGTTKDVTSEASYQIADSSIANVNGNSVKGLAEGNTNLTITYQGQTVTVPVTVTQPVITGLQVVPNPVSIAKGQSQELQVTANYSDGSSRDVTGEAGYQVADGTIADVNSGKITGLAKGSTQVTISYQGQEVQVPIAVTDPVVTGLKATPNPVSIAKGTSQQLTVTAIYSDGSTKEVTQEASYQIENASVATVDKGLVRGITQGNTNVTISYQGQSIQVPVTVTAPILVGLTAEPSQINLEKGQSQKLTVKAEYSDGSVVDVSDVATYQVANGSIASITNGVLKGEAPGSTLVTASYQGKTVQVPVTVTAPVLTGITVTPQSISLEEGKSQKLTVTANYSDGSTKDVTAEVSYQSGNNAIAVVNNGVVTGVKQGNTQVTVSYQGKTVQVPVTVTPPPVTQIGISIIPNPIQVSKYGSVRLQVLTVMSDGSTKDVTMAAQFTSLNTSIATVKSNGVVYGKNNGQTSIIVTYNGKEYEIPVIVGQIPVITKDKPQSQTPVVIYPEKQDSGTPIIVYPQS